jgi:Ca2+-binding RTX toxin-like protein
MRLLRVGVIVGFAVAQGLFLVGTANAASASVWVEGGRLMFVAAAEHANDVTVAERDGRLWVSDVMSLTPGTGCDRETATQVSCRADGIGSLFFLLGDRDDRAAFPIARPVGVDGGTGNDTLTGSAVGDTIYGGVGADTISGGSGKDVLYGDLDSSAPACAGLDQPGCGDKVYGGDHDDQLYGGEWGDTLLGGSGADTLSDKSGGTTLIGGAGDDTIIGGNGPNTPDMRDSVNYSDHPTGVIVDLAAQKGGTPPETDTIIAVQDVDGGPGDDTLTGDGNNNRIRGHGGNDGIDGAAGMDFCNGGGQPGDTLVNCE